MSAKYLIDKVISLTGLDRSFEWNDDIIDCFISEAERLSVLIKHIILDNTLTNEEKIFKCFETLKDQASYSLSVIQKNTSSTHLKSAISSVFGSKII
jgi:hypothetical protein